MARRLIATCLMTVAFFAVGCQERANPEHSNPEQALRSLVLRYLAYPEFRSEDMLRQITGISARLELHDLDEKMLYFSIPKTAYSKADLEQLTLDPGSVELGREQSDGEIELGNYSLERPGIVFFRFPDSDFKVDPTTAVRIPYQDIEYNISLKELIEYEKSWTYGGDWIANLSKSSGRKFKNVANHAVLVAKPGEPSLNRFIKALDRDMTKQEDKIQHLLNFVTGQVAYDNSEIFDQTEVLQRASEVLMRRKSDCSGKVILFASLLEQIKADYLLVYRPGTSGDVGHIAVMVAGDFPNRNGYSLTWKDTVYHLAETTAPGFLIGTSRLVGTPSQLRFDYLQKPGQPLIDVQTNTEVPFL